MGVASAAALATLSALTVYQRADVRSDSRFIARAESGAVVPAYAFPDEAVADGRVRWQLLFAIGSVEVRHWFECTENPDGTVTMGERSESVTFDVARLSAMVESYQAFAAKCKERGARRQLLPVSYQHAIEARQFGFWAGAELSVGDLTRAGNVHDLTLITSGVDVPGLYALVEWTPNAWASIRSGEWVDVSPTTGTCYGFNDGAEITNEFAEVLLAVGLVDDGALHDIGSARDGLPFGAVPYDVAKARSKRAEGVLSAASAAIRMRSAMAAKQRNSESATTAPVQANAAEPAAPAETDAPMSMSREEIAAICAEACKPYVDACEAMRADLELLKTEIGKLKGDSGSGGEDGGDGEAPAVEANAAPADNGDAAAVARADKAQARMVDEATNAAIDAGKLLPASVPAFRAALRANDKAKADALLCDVSALSFRSGGSGGVLAPPAPAPVRRSTSEIDAEVRRKHGIAPTGMLTRAAATEITNTIKAARIGGLLEE